MNLNTKQYEIHSDQYSYPDWVIEDLAKSGLNIQTFPILPLRDDAVLKELLGYLTINDEEIINVGGYLMPYPNIPGYNRLKLRRKIGDAKYLSTTNAGNHPYIPHSVLDIAKQYKPDTPLYITEGEKKAVKATLEGFPCIGLSGVWCFKDKEHEFLPELNELNFKHRKCYICFDSDTKHKLHVRHAEIRLTVEIINRGAQVNVVRLPDGEYGEKIGLDDYLVKYGRGKFTALIKHSEEVSV